MAKRKNKKELIGLIIILIGAGLIFYKLYSTEKIEIEEKKAIDNYFVEVKDDKIDEEIEEDNNTNNTINYIAVLNIPKIDLERGLVDPNSYLNDVDYNIEILKDSDMPDKENGNVILASHSGSSRVAFFNGLKYLNLGDEIIIYYKNKKYVYNVSNIYLIEKTGEAEIKRDSNINTLTLITCKSYTNKQIVVISNLTKIE